MADLEIKDFNEKSATITTDVTFRSGNAYFFFRMGQITLAANKESYLHMRSDGDSAEVRLSQGRISATERRVPGLIFPVLRGSFPDFAEIYVAVRRE